MLMPGIGPIVGGAIVSPGAMLMPGIGPIVGGAIVSPGAMLMPGIGPIVAPGACRSATQASKSVGDRMRTPERISA